MLMIQLVLNILRTRWYDGKGHGCCIIIIIIHVDGLKHCAKPVIASGSYYFTNTAELLHVNVHHLEQRWTDFRTETSTQVCISPELWGPPFGVICKMVAKMAEPGGK